MDPYIYWEIFLEKLTMNFSVKAFRWKRSLKSSMTKPLISGYCMRVKILDSGDLRIMSMYKLFCVPLDILK